MSPTPSFACSSRSSVHKWMRLSLIPSIPLSAWNGCRIISEKDTDLTATTLMWLHSLLKFIVDRNCNKETLLRPDAFLSFAPLRSPFLLSFRLVFVASTFFILLRDVNDWCKQIFHFRNFSFYYSLFLIWCCDLWPFYGNSEPFCIVSLEHFIPVHSSRTHALECQWKCEIKKEMEMTIKSSETNGMTEVFKM